MINEEDYKRVLNEHGIEQISQANIRQCVAVSKAMEPVLGEPFVHLEFGVPGLPACKYGIEAEKEALERGIPNTYANVAGEPFLKEAAARFVEAFLDVKVTPECCVPTVGSMQASYTLFLILSQYEKGRDTILFIDPGFPAHHTQVNILGIRAISFDIYNYRGEKMRAKLEEYLRSGRVCSIFYSNPNNPTWACLTEEELKIIAEMADKYDALVVEDLAYLGMDFRKDYSKPYQPPFPPTAAKYTERYMLLISASKIFSYAGGRIAIAVFSPRVFKFKTPLLKERYGLTDTFGGNYIYTYLYCSSSGTVHSTQYALAAMMNAAVEGKINFVEDMKEYGRRAAKCKEIFKKHNFYLVYDKDGDEPLSDGFFFTMGYIDPETGKPMECEKLLSRLMRCGICAITLNTTCSEQQGIRICVSKLSSEDDYKTLDKRLGDFQKS
nr:pyridoxal phosphate-dependent aminotransferase [Paludibacteraceae bacterium]